MHKLFMSHIETDAWIRFVLHVMILRPIKQFTVL